MSPTDWRVTVEITTGSPEGHASLRLDLPRSEWTLDELHDLALGAAESAGVLTDKTTSINVDVKFPEAELALLDRLHHWYRGLRLTRDGAPTR